MPGDNAIYIPPSQLNHALLIANVRSAVSIGEGSAGFAFNEIAIEIAIVGGKDEGRIAFDAQILRGISVTTASIGANAGEDLDVVAMHETEPTLSVELDELLNIFGVDAAVIAAWLPSLAGVIAKLLALNPNCGLWKKIDATHVIPVRVADDDIRNVF